MSGNRKLLCYVVATLALAFMGRISAQAVNFGAAVAYKAGDAPRGVAVGDFNGDGIPDLAVVNNLSNNVSILLGKGNGGVYQAAVNYPVGNLPTSVAVGDFNGDGYLDLAVTNSNGFQAGGDISILLGNGNGTFQAAVNYPASLGAPYYVAVSDFNGDGFLDLAVANHGGDVSIYLGNGNGTFQTAVNYRAGANPQAIAIGDFNGDKILDLAVANQSSNNVSILLGNGNGTFQHAVNYVVGTQPGDVATGDFNTDGVLDLAVTNFGSNSLAILLGAGNGTFQTPSFITTGTNPNGVAVADFNGDGKADLVESNRAGSAENVGVFLGNGDGTFQAGVTFGVGGGPGLLVAVDLNHDGAPDIAVADSGASLDVLLNTGGTYLVTTSSSNPVFVGVPVTFTTTVTASLSGTNTPTGSVTFEDGANFLGVSAISSGQATFTTSSLSLGPHTINAIYSGDANFNPNSAPPFIETVQNPPAVTLSATSLSFGVQLLNTTSPPQMVTLTDTGSGPLTITSITVSGNFAQTNTCGTGLAAGANCTITVTFTPTKPFALTGAITITDNAPDSPQTISLTGIGTRVELAPTNLTFAPQTVGTTSAPQTITLTNVGKGSLAISTVRIVGTNAGDFAQTNTCGTGVAGGASCTFSVTFTPKATGSRTAMLAVVDNGGGSPQLASLSGTGM